jgi:hypothetical protein
LVEVNHSLDVWVGENPVGLTEIGLDDATVDFGDPELHAVLLEHGREVAQLVTVGGAFVLADRTASNPRAGSTNAASGLPVEAIDVSGNLISEALTPVPPSR